MLAFFISDFDPVAIAKEMPQMNLKSFTKYLATGEYVPTADAASFALDAGIDWKADQLVQETLEHHDRRFHPNGYKEGDKCNFRERLDRGDLTDMFLDDIRFDAEAEEESSSAPLSVDDRIGVKNNNGSVWYAKVIEVKSPKTVRVAGIGKSEGIKMDVDMDEVDSVLVPDPDTEGQMYYKPAKEYFAEGKNSGTSQSIDYLKLSSDVDKIVKNALSDVQAAVPENYAEHSWRGVANVGGVGEVKTPFGFVSVEGHCGTKEQYDKKDSVARQSAEAAAKHLSDKTGREWRVYGVERYDRDGELIEDFSPSKWKECEDITYLISGDDTKVNLH